MKNKLIYLFLLLPVFINGCIKTYHDPGTNPVNNNYPLGTFAGKFTRIHKNPITLKSDTVTAILKLTLSTNTGFSVSGDTTMYHAGSYGSFSEDFVNMEFSDITAAVNYKTKKTHLSGYYTYKYNGSYLEIVNGGKSDTLTCTYHLTKMQ
jgi:hypothetical protein